MKKGSKHTKKSRLKMSKSRLGKNPWNYGIKINRKLYPNFGHLIKHTLKGIENIKSARKGKMIGENHWEWKGDSVGYFSLHNWVKRYLGRALVCQHCGKISSLNSYGRNTIHWSNIDHKYKRNLTDWISLCSTCHGKYDKARGNRRSKI